MMDLEDGKQVEDSADCLKSVKLSCIKKWDEVINDEAEKAYDNIISFPVDTTINSKIYLCEEDISTIELDTVVLPVNEMVLMKTAMAFKIHKAAGPDLSNEYTQLKDLKTGCCRITSAHNLPCRYIIHAMEPKVCLKYETAAETAIHNCYRSSMEIAAEKCLQSIGFAPLYFNNDNDLMCRMTHIAMRTVRCYMANFPSQFDAVVFVVDHLHHDMYSKLMSVYFPRSREEAMQGGDTVRGQQWDEWGACVHEERAIRISTVVDENDDDAKLRSGESDSESDSESAAMTGHDLHAFATMSGDHDKKRKWQLDSMGAERRLRSQQRVYARLLRQARSENLACVATSGALYLAGLDRDASPIVVIVGRFIHADRLNFNKAMLYMIHLLDPVVSSDYCIVYFHTLMTSHNQPPRHFVQRVYDTLDQRYRKNLKRFFLVHATLRSKVSSWFFTTFIANEIKKKITYLKSVQQLYHFVSSDQIDIPPFVLDFDMKINPQVEKAQGRSSNSTLL